MLETDHTQPRLYRPAFALLPTTPGGFGLIHADPPWPYRNRRVNGAASKHYATLSLADLCALPVSAIAAPDSVLLLRATWPMVPSAVRLMGAWGFTYKTGLPWIKVQGPPQLGLWGEPRFTPTYGPGWWIRGCSEALLVGVRGKDRAPRTGFVGLISPNGEHSRKPAHVYQLAEAMSPGSYVELFAHQRRHGWDSWGDEVALGDDSMVWGVP